MRYLLSTSLIFLLALPALADRSPVRRGAESDNGPKRGGIDDGRVGRRPMEGQPDYSLEQRMQKEQTKTINLLTPPRCGARNAKRFKKKLLNMASPGDQFYVEIWGNKRTFHVLDNIFYFLRSNRRAYVTMFWIGPEGSVFIPFSNLQIEADRDHKVDPRNIIVEPVGLERWRVFATTTPHAFPCRGSEGEFLSALQRLKDAGPWAAGRWDVMSKVRKRRIRRRWR